MVEPIMGKDSGTDPNGTWHGSAPEPSETDLAVEALLKGETQAPAEHEKREPTGHVKAVMDLAKAQTLGGEGYQPTGDADADVVGPTTETVVAFHQVPTEVSDEDDEPEDSITNDQTMAARESVDQYVDWYAEKAGPVGSQQGPRDGSGPNPGCPIKGSEPDLEKGAGVAELRDFLEKAGGPFIGPKGGKWADAKHTIPWKEGAHGAQAQQEAKQEATLETAEKVLALGIHKQDANAVQKATDALIKLAQTKGNKGKAMAILRGYLKDARAVAKTMVGRVEADNRRKTPVAGREPWTEAHLMNARDIRDTIDAARAKVAESGKSEKTKTKEKKARAVAGVAYRQKSIKKEQERLSEFLDGKYPSLGMVLSSVVQTVVQRNEEIADLYEKAGQPEKAAEHKQLAEHADSVGSMAHAWMAKKKVDIPALKEGLRQVADGKLPAPKEPSPAQVKDISGKPPKGADMSPQQEAEAHGQLRLFKGLKGLQQFLDTNLENGEMYSSDLLKADDGKPGESLGETSTQELETTLEDIKHRLKSSPEDQALQTREKAISAELGKRKGGGLDKAQPSDSANISPEKARQILHDGTVHGKPITEQQRKFFGAIGGHLPAPKTKKSLDSAYGGEPLTKFVGKLFGGGKGGEGSRGGKVIGHDSHGKPIYDKHGTHPHGMTSGGHEVHLPHKGDMEGNTIQVMDRFDANHKKWKAHDHHDAMEIHRKVAEKTKDKKEKMRHEEAARHHERLGDKKEKKEQQRGQKYGASEGRKKEVARKWESQNEFRRSMDPMDSIGEGMNGLAEFLEKSGGLPEGDHTKLAKPKSATQGGSADGGELDGVGGTKGAMPAAPGPGQDADGQLKGASSGKSEKLSEDDAEVEKQMSTHKKPIETIRKGDVPAQLRDSVAHENAIVASRLRKAQMEKSADEQAADLVKSEDFYHGGAPSLNLSQDVDLRMFQRCQCGDVFSKSLSACPNCGRGTVVHRPMPGHYIGGETVVPNYRPALRKSRDDEDVQIGGSVQPIRVYR